jgi:hypothetical protein
MRVMITIFFGGLIALAIPAATSLARTSDVPKAADTISSPACYSYEQNPDGSWKQTPCQEDGLKTPVRQKISTQNTGKTAR